MLRTWVPGPSSRSFPDVEIEGELLFLEQSAPVEEEKSGNEHDTENDGEDPFPGKSAVGSIGEAGDGVARHDQHDGIAHHFGAKERRHNADRFHFRDGGGGEEDRVRERRHGENENEQPAMPEFPAQLFPDELQFLMFVAFEK